MSGDKVAIIFADFCLIEIGFTQESLLIVIITIFRYHDWKNLKMDSAYRKIFKPTKYSTFCTSNE